MSVEKQPMRFTEEELSLLKNIFKDREDLLIALRSKMLQFASDKQKKLLNNFLNEDLVALLRKFFLPTLEENPEVPLGQTSSTWFSTYNDIKMVPVEDSFPIIQSKYLFNRYIDQELRKLEGEKIEYNISLKEMIIMKDEYMPVDLNINIRTYNSLVSYIEQQVNQIKILSNRKEETEDERSERIKRDSAR